MSLKSIRIKIILSNIVLVFSGIIYSCKSTEGCFAGISNCMKIYPSSCYESKSLESATGAILDYEVLKKIDGFSKPEQMSLWSYNRIDGFSPNNEIILSGTCNESQGLSGVRNANESNVLPPIVIFDESTGKEIRYNYSMRYDGVICALNITPEYPFIESSRVLIGIKKNSLLQWNWLQDAKKWERPYCNTHDNNSKEIAGKLANINPKEIVFADIFHIRSTREIIWPLLYTAQTVLSSAPEKDNNVFRIKNESSSQVFHNKPIEIPEICSIPCNLLDNDNDLPEIDWNTEDELYDIYSYGNHHSSKNIILSRHPDLFSKKKLPDRWTELLKTENAIFFKANKLLDSSAKKFDMAIHVIRTLATIKQLRKMLSSENNSIVKSKYFCPIIVIKSTIEADLINYLAPNCERFILIPKKNEKTNVGYGESISDLYIRETEMLFNDYLKQWPYTESSNITHRTKRRPFKIVTWENPAKENAPQPLLDMLK